jgi:hypothetical protein
MPNIFNNAHTIVGYVNQDLLNLTSIVVDDVLIDNNKITSSSGCLIIEPSLCVDDITIDSNIISSNSNLNLTAVSNSNINLNTIGSGQVMLSLDPISAMGAATKQYVDSLSIGLDYKDSCAIGTRGPINTSLYASSPSGGRFFEVVTSIAFDLSEKSLQIGDRVLIKNQVDQRQNGIYLLNAITSSVGSFFRTTDSDNFVEPNEVSAGNSTYVETGLEVGHRAYVLGGSGTMVLNTDILNWIQFSPINSFENQISLTTSISGSIISGTLTSLFVFTKIGSLVMYRYNDSFAIGIPGLESLKHLTFLPIGWRPATSVVNFAMLVIDGVEQTGFFRFDSSGDFDIFSEAHGLNQPITQTNGGAIGLIESQGFFTTG